VSKTFYRPDGFPVNNRQCQSTEGSEIKNMVWYGILEFNVPLDTV